MARRSASARRLRRYVRYPLEGLLAWAAFALLGRLSIDRASALGGWLGRALGPRLGVSRRAAAHLARALPELSQAEVARIVRGMWDNLGRVAAEYPHLGRLRLDDGDGRIEVVGAEHVERLLEEGVGGIFFSAHFGNWEIASLGASQLGVPLTQVYRAANNPFVERLLRRARRDIKGAHLAKGPGTARELVTALKGGAHLAVLADQKLREGIPVPFFGRDAMTAPMIAQLALRHRSPVLPARVERLAGARFRLTIFPPRALPESGDHPADVAAAMGLVNATIEDWIRARPEHWLWLHRRWDD